jgi:hypothetical protein
MKRLIKTCTVLLLLIGLSISVTAQEQANTIPPQVQKFKRFIGTWTATVNLRDDQQKIHNFKQQFVFTSIADGNGLYVEELADSPEFGKMAGSDLIGYDPYEKLIHCYTVDNMGTTHDHICTWKSDDNFYMEHNSIRNGKKYAEKINIVFKGNDSMEASMTSLLDGKVTMSSTATYTRVK